MWQENFVTSSGIEPSVENRANVNLSTYSREITTSSRARNYKLVNHPHIWRGTRVSRCGNLVWAVLSGLLKILQTSRYLVEGYTW